MIGKSKILCAAVALSVGIVNFVAAADELKNRPLLEEYTGLRCQYCPEGYVTLAQMNDELGDDLVALVYHCSAFETGCMVTMNDDELPVNVSWFPSGTINRQTLLNPDQFLNSWRAASEKDAVASVSVTLAYIDETHVKATAYVSFVEDISDSPFLVSIALAANNLHNDIWLQKNSYSDETSLTGPYWDLFVGQGAQVSGLIFNDVIAYYKDVRGIEGSLPQQIEAGELYKAEVVIDMDDVKNTRNKAFINADATLHAVAMVVDSNTGAPINCNKSSKIAYDSYAALSVCEAEAKVVEEYYVDLTGARMELAAGGFCICVRRMADGSVRTSKVLFR